MLAQAMSRGLSCEESLSVTNVFASAHEALTGSYRHIRKANLR